MCECYYFFAGMHNDAIPTVCVGRSSAVLGHGEGGLVVIDLEMEKGGS